MNTLDGYLRQFEELDRLTKPLRDMEATMKAAFDSATIHDAIRRLDIDKQFKAAMEAAFDTAPIQEALRQLDAAEWARKVFDDRLGGYAETAQEEIRRIEELTTGLNIRPPEFPILPIPPVASNIANRMPKAYESEPESKPKRPIGFIDTNDL